MRRLAINKKEARVHSEYKKIGQAHLVVGVPGYSALDKRRYALDVLSAILGGYSSSRLVVSVRDDLGLAYYVGADVNYHEDTGSFSAYAGINLRNIDLGITAIMKEFQKAATRPITKKRSMMQKATLKERSVCGLKHRIALRLARDGLS